MNKIEVIKTNDINLCKELDNSIFKDGYKLNMFLDDSLKDLYILKVDDKYIGYAYLHGDNIEKELYRIGIIKEYQNKGFGTKFLKELLNNLETERLLLEVSSKNVGAQKLYLKCNFKQFLVRKDYYNNGEDAILMEYIKEGNKNER